jgi:hypothetical protein
MRRFCFIALSLSVLWVLILSVPNKSWADNDAVKGEYVEVRTASVFAGACHYNGELTTTGRDALIAWNVKSGKWQGVELAGVRAVAVVTANENLANNTAMREAEIVIGDNASDAQSFAMLNALRTRYADTLGKIISVRRGPLSFAHEGKAYSVQANRFAAIAVEAMPDDLCCKMPQLVWYSPLFPLEHRKVGYTTKAVFEGSSVGEPWQRSGENSAFYGSFSF